MQGVKAVIAMSFERIHRSNLLGMGILPCQFEPSTDLKEMNINGTETYSFDLGDKLEVNKMVNVTATRQDGSTASFQVKLRLDTEPEIAYFMNGGILRYVLRKLI